MADLNFERETRRLFGSPSGKKLSENRGEIEKIAGSEEAARLREMLEGRLDINSAVKRGDTEALKSAVMGVMDTKEGKALKERLSELFK